MHKLLTTAGLILSLFIEASAQLSTPKVEAVYGGTINAITAMPISSTKTRVFISTMSANSIFYADMTTGGGTAPSFGSFTVMPGAGAADGFGSNISRIAAHSATGDLYFISQDGALVRTNPSGTGAKTVINNGVQSVCIVNASDSVSYIFVTDATGLRYGTLDSTGKISEGAGSPIKLAATATPPMGPNYPEICPDTVNGKLYYAIFSPSPELFVTSDPYDSLSPNTSISAVNTAPLSGGTAQWTAFGVGNDGTLFFGGTANFQKVIAYSKDDGATWTVDSTQLSGMGGPDFSFSNTGGIYTVYYSSVYSQFDSSKGFASWNRLGNQSYETHANDGSVLVDPLNSSVVYMVTDQGLGVSVNGGSVINEIDDGITAVQVNGLVLDSSKTEGWVASKAGIRHVTNYSVSPAWSAAMFPNSDGAPYYSVGMVGGNPGSVYVGNSRVYKTTDAGSTWAMVFDASKPPYNFNGPSNPLGVSTIQVDRFDTNLVMAGYAPENSSFDSAQGGVFYSTDGGNTWSQLLCLSNTTGEDVNASDIVFAREGDSTVAYIGAEYNPYFPDSTKRGGGVYRAVWNGSSWSVREDMSSAYTSTGKDIIASISALTLSAGGDTLYASGSDTSGSIPAVYYKPLNGSGEWTPLSNTGLPTAGNFMNFNLNVAKALTMGNDTLYCAINNQVFQRDASTDTSWTLGYSYPAGDAINVLYYDDLLVGTGTGLYGQHISATSTAVRSKPSQPDRFMLSQNYPNPFNPTTRISYSVPVSGLVTLAVYDVLGQKVATLVSELKRAGSYEATFDGSRFASGVYLYRLDCAGYTSVKKMILVK